jgi:hypothetical protein
VADKCNKEGCDSWLRIASRTSTGQHRNADGSNGVSIEVVIESANNGDGEGNETETDNIM